MTTSDQKRSPVTNWPPLTVSSTNPLDDPGFTPCGPSTHGSPLFQPPTLSWLLANTCLTRRLSIDLRHLPSGFVFIFCLPTAVFPGLRLLASTNPIVYQPSVSLKFLRSSSIADASKTNCTATQQDHPARPPKTSRFFDYISLFMPIITFGIFYVNILFSLCLLWPMSPF